MFVGGQIQEIKMVTEANQDQNPKETKVEESQVLHLPRNWPHQEVLSKERKEEQGARRTKRGSGSSPGWV